LDQKQWFQEKNGSEDSMVKSEISSIIKNNLKIDNMVKSIGSIFKNERFRDKVDFKPYFQRNYVWDGHKASYFIESIFLGTEIPPIVMFDNGNTIEVIDGRQRYETILKFMNNELELSNDGVKTLKALVNDKYYDLSEESKDAFEDTKIRILMCSVLNEPELSDDKEDKIKKEIFKRYNSGIIPLRKEEIQRAEFIEDEVTIEFSKLFNSDLLFLNEVSNYFLSGRANKAIRRDKINKLISRIRLLIALPYIPINNYANSSTKYDHINIYYTEKISKTEPDIVIQEFMYICKYIKILKKKIESKNLSQFKTIIFYETNFWIFSVLHMNFMDDLEQIDFDDYLQYLIDNDVDKDMFESTGSHFHKAIKLRHKYVAKYFEDRNNITMEKYFANTVDYSTITNRKEIEISERKKYKLNKPEPTSMTIEDILVMIKKSRFQIRPEYQRSEVTNKKKSSYLLESIMLGIKVPPIFVYKRSDKVYEVVDGQQRLLSIIGFLGEEYLNEEGKREISTKHKYKLENLKILQNINGLTYEDIKSEQPDLVDKILDFQLEVIEIDGEINPNFDSVDLFLRLNTKPYPIGENSFEMWNSYVDKQIIVEIKQLASQYLGTYLKAKNNRMQNDELIASLAYIDYKNRCLNIEFTRILNIYVKAERVNTRITRKSDITKILDEVSRKDISAFLPSINRVAEFFNKVELLTNGDHNRVKYLFGVSETNAIPRTNQNYYVLWILLKNIDDQYIITEKNRVIEKIRNIYTKMRYFPNTEGINELVSELINPLW